MAKALKTAALVVGAVALVATGVGAVALGGLAGSLTIAGISTGTLFLVSGGLTVAASLLQKTPKVAASQTDRLTASVNPGAFRHTVLGQTAMPVEVRYEEWSGKDQEYCDWTVLHASHACEAIDEIWFETTMAWSRTTGVVGKYVGYFSVPHIVLEGSPANAFVLPSGKWNQNARLTGCAYSHWRFKLTGNSKKAESPFVSGLPSRITVIGRGGKLYDPRRDSTVPGGNGPMRADDQSTWRFTTDDGVTIGENLPLQILRVVLGWRIRNPSTGALKLATGSGVPPRRINLASIAVAANLADELVNRSAGGQEPRYHGAGVVSEGDDPKTVLDMLCTACCARFRDTGGKLSLVIAHNDLAAAATEDGLNDDDVVGAFTWDPDAALEATPNVVRGKYVDATTNSLYQLIDYPEIRLPSLDGQDRIFPLDLGVVESPSQAQRIAKQVLQRKQYPREFSAPFDIRAWKYGVGDVVPFTFAALGFDRALFRIKDQELGQGGVCNMTLTVENAAIYAWDADDAAPVQPAEPIVYDSRNNPLILAIDEAAMTADWPTITGEGKPEDYADVTKDHLPDAWAEFTGMPAKQVVDDLLSAVDTIATETMRAATWRGESDDILYMPDGRPVRVAVEAIGANIDGVQQFVAFLKEVDASAKTSKFLFSARSDGSIVGIEGIAGGGFNQLSFVASRFLFVDENGGNPINAMTYENGVWKLKAIVVDTLEVNTVKAKNIVGAAVQQTKFDPVAGDITIARGTIATVASVTFTKDEAASMVKVTFFGMFWSTDDLQFNCSVVVDGSVSYPAGQQDNIFDNRNSNAKSTITPFVYLTGLSAGQHTISFNVQNVEEDNISLTVKAGSTLEILELKQGAV
jgi:hypothetical protein